MARLKYLDDWAQAVLDAPRSQLNARWPDSFNVQEEIRHLPFFTPHREGFRRINSALLLKLHAHLRGARCEWKFWDGVISFLEHPLPDEVANDLIDRDVITVWLSHTRQSDAVMQRLIPLVDDALLTVAKEAYTWHSKSLSDFDQVLATSCANDTGREWMLQSLSYYLPSSEEKRAAYFRAIENHPQRDEYIERSTTSANQVWPTIEQRLTRFIGSSGTELIGYVDHPDGYLGIARDPETPLEILRLLRDLLGSKAIRHAARINLRENHNEVES